MKNINNQVIKENISLEQLPEHTLGQRVVTILLKGSEKISCVSRVFDMKENKAMYELFEEELVCEGNQKYISYGVRHIPTGNMIQDITMKKGKIARFVEFLNKLELEVVHFRDVVEDYLVELQ